MMKPNVLDLFEETVHSEIYSRCSKSTDTEWGWYSYQQDETLGVVFHFQSSMSKLDWKLNFDIRTKALGSGVIQVHRGFYQKWESVKLEILELLEDLYTDNKQQPVDIILVGHSQGGATASVAGLDLRFMNDEMINRVSVTTFGCPRFLARKSKKIIDRKESWPFTHYQNGNDAVTKVPFKWTGYADFGGTTVIGSLRKWYKYLPSDHLPNAYRKSLNAYFSRV